MIEKINVILKSNILLIVFIVFGFVACNNKKTTFAEEAQNTSVDASSKLEI